MSNDIKMPHTVEDEAVDSRYDDFPNGLSHEILDHAPATSHGTYLESFQDEVEDLENYQPGGYHPIHLGDRLGATSRYLVIHKLGYGGFSTVWLCRDSQVGQYVAVKVHTADVSADKIPDLRLVDLGKTSPGAEYINIPKDNFSLEGPNGTHQCLVLTLLGPPVSPHLWISMQNPGPVLRKMCQQTVQAMQFLHQNGLCHGDFRPANILVKLASLDHLSEEKVLSLINQPEKSQVLTESGEKLPPSTPDYLVASADPSRLGVEYLKEEICIIDFGESFPTSSPPANLGIPENYLPPEVLVDFEDETAIGLGCDLWALGCTLFEIRRQMALFYMIEDPDELLAETVNFFGKLPETLWRKWEARADFFDDNGARVTNLDYEIHTLDVALAHKLEVGKRESPDDKKVLAVSEKEQRLCKDLLLKLFAYTPGDRLSADEAARHDWFKFVEEK
ncbi:Serine/threonine-protein kinase SRPK [Lachnellula suecica]|uniref:EKC/KEOPS complex subunit BUD32 n=1 Tax=Lachnellula suecica TaxID=602035 RepID=A0A8T9C353_9HELO|nr:Serine/threonine-protein kinase SRPK [Lachnellula suecica]